jgi:cytochrome c5
MEVSVRPFIPAIAAAIAVSGCQPSAPPLPQVSNAVRGYLAVAVGRSAKAEAGGIYSREVQDKDIYLPGVSVYLDDPQAGKRSKPVRTDLSGRFTLFAPDTARYRICWESKVYDKGCTPVFVSTGSGPQFVSTVNIKVPHRQDYVAVMGRITTPDGTVPRTYEPLLNINAFATVGLTDSGGGRLADVFVNNFGDYLLPYVPVKQRIGVAARIESAKLTQEIRPEAQLETAPLHQMNLVLANNRPRLDPLVALDPNTNRRVQDAAPGSKVKIAANGRDKDGDPVEFAWFVDEGAGQLSQTTGATVEWTLPSTPGRYSVTAVAFDNKGGYDKGILSVLAEGKGVPFGGIVVDPGGAVVANASIEIVGNPLLATDNTGRFQTNVKAADRYVLNIRKEGYALNSRVYDGAVTGGRWILRPGQVVTIDPTRDTRIQHERSQRDCPGPASTQAGLGVAGDSLRIPQWQDGQGNIIDPPGQADGRERSRVILPRTLRLPGCGPGITVEIPANSIVDSSGNAATAPIKATIATVDLFSPQQMPGDDGVLASGGGGGFLQSFGAGSLDLPAGYKLKPGASGKITIPVDRARLAGGALQPTVPLLSYDEQKGTWVEDGTLTLATVNGVQVYAGTITHLTSYNADTFFNNAACLRVFSPSLPGNYNLEVMSPYPDGTPHYKNYPIDNTSATEHVIYNITPNANMTLAPMTQGATPQLLGFYIVNSGPPESPSTSPNVPPGPPYVSCKSFVVLKVGSAPDAPFGGEFLNGIGFIAAANLGFDDLTAAGPTGNALRDAIVAASKSYYTSVDPTTVRETFAKFKTKNGFNQNPATPAAGEIVAQYANSGDLGFGRDMHCLKNANGNVACYVSNYGDGYNNVFPGGGTDDQDDANAAGQRQTVGNSAEVATVAMEYSPIENDPVADKVVKFFVYKKGLANYGRSISANLDGRGERPVPQLCMICHAGQIPNQAGGVPAFGTAAQVKLGSRFLQFDHRFFTFPNNPANLAKANQEAKIKSLNLQIVNAAPPAPNNDAIHQVVTGMYNNGASATQIRNFTVPGWVNGASANAPNQAGFYTGVVADVCRTCHAAQSFGQLQFNTSDKFLNVTAAVSANNRLMLGTAQLRACGDYVMPHALRTHDIFWNVYWDVVNWGPPPTPFPTQFQNFGNGVGGPTWKPGLCTSFVTNLVASPSHFYQQAIQPIWNGKCVACHVAAGQASFLPLTEGLSYTNLKSRVTPPNDADNAGALLQRITGAGPGSKMPLGCIAPPTPPGPNQLPCLEQTDIDKIKAWIRSGAN